MTYLLILPYKRMMLNLVFELQALHVVHVTVAVEQISLQGSTRPLSINENNKSSKLTMEIQSTSATNITKYSI